MNGLYSSAVLQLTHSKLSQCNFNYKYSISLLKVSESCLNVFSPYNGMNNEVSIYVERTLVRL